MIAVGAGGWAWHRWTHTGSLPLPQSAVAGFALFLLLTAFLAPRVHAPVQRALETFGRLVAQAFTWLVLALVFALIFVPGRIVLLALRRDPLQRRRAPGGSGESLLQTIPPAVEAARRFPRQF